MLPSHDVGTMGDVVLAVAVERLLVSLIRDATTTNTGKRSLFMFGGIEIT